MWRQALGRDFEISSYFPHLALDDRLLKKLFRALAEAGLRVGAPAGDRYPLLEYVAHLRGGGARIDHPDPEELLRGRTGAVPAGYGLVPLKGAVASGAAAFLTLRFEARSARTPELDGVHLRISDEFLRAESRDDGEAVGPGWRALLGWYGTLCELLHVAYGYGDWEELFLQNAIPPSRADVQAGRIDLLFRLNCFGPALAVRIGRAHLEATPAQLVVKLRYGGVLIGNRLDYDRSSETTFMATAAHLGLRARSSDIGPPRSPGPR